MSCPKCASDDWKFASVVHAGGLSSISTTSVGVGVGVEGDAFGGGAGIGSGISKTSGTQQTALSKFAAPPEKPMRPAVAWLIFGVATVVIGIMFFSNMNLNDHPIFGYFLFLFAPIGVLVALGRIVMKPDISKAIAAKHELAMEEYSRKKMCMRCGTFFFEEDKGSSSFATPIPASASLSPETQSLSDTGPMHSGTKQRPSWEDTIKPKGAPSSNSSGLNTGAISIGVRAVGVVACGAIVGYNLSFVFVRLFATYTDFNFGATGGFSVLGLTIVAMAIYARRKLPTLRVIGHLVIAAVLSVVINSVLNGSSSTAKEDCTGDVQISEECRDQRFGNRYGGSR